MKNLVLTLLFSLSSVLSFGQDITGQWNGVLKVQEGMTLRLVFHIEESDDGYTATLDSPDQNGFGMKATSVTFDSPELLVELSALNAAYKGTWKGGEFAGTFTQAGQSFDVPLSREEIAAPTVNRPQEPTGPLPYLVEDVKFQGGADNVELAGTLTLPDSPGPHPVVVLISGSGAQNRDEEFMNHKPFLVLADYLTRQGIGVLRYDDRGFAESTGKFDEATSLDFTEDALAAVAFLKGRSQVDVSQIGLVGHSEGGLIAPVAASKSDDVAFIVLLAGPGVSGKEILLQQTRAITKASGLTEEQIEGELELSRGVFDLIAEHRGEESLEHSLREYLENAIQMETVRGVPKDQFIDSQIAQINRPWFQYFLIHEPAEYLSKVSCPVLAVNGEKDIQVIPENLSDIETALKEGGNDQVTVIEFPGMNHLFQACETCTMSEYATIEETFSPIAMEAISEWILAQR